jgi:MFS family permease
MGTTAESLKGLTKNPLWRFLFHHEIDEYPSSANRAGRLALAVAATIVLYYVYFTQTGVTPNILRYYHMPFADYVWIVIISNLIGAFASLPASFTDRVGRSNVIIYGLLAVGLLVWLGVPAAHSTFTFGVVISAMGLVEGAVLVATPAMVRDYSPQLGRASAMGFWTVGPVAGSLVTSIVANHTLTHFVDWQSQFDISGISAVATFAIAFLFMKDLSPKLRDQLIVSARDRALIEARAQGLSEEDVEKAIVRPWRQILHWDLVASSVGISLFLLLYFVASSFFTIYYTVIFVGSNNVSLSTAQVNGLNTWFWGADIIGLIVVGIISDRLRVRKPLMAIGVVGALVTLVIFGSYASNAHTGYYTLALTSAILAIFIAMVYAPWMAGYTETIEAKNPALVATGLSLWGWILRLIVGFSFMLLPVLISSTNTVVDNQSTVLAVCAPVKTPTHCVSGTVAAKQHLKGVTLQTFIAEHPKTIAFANSHTAFLAKVNANIGVVAALQANESAANIAAAQQALGSSDFLTLVEDQKQLQTLIEPYMVQLNYISAHQSALQALQKGVGKSPKQWQHWFWFDMIGMVLFLPTIFLTKGRWSPKKAKEDWIEHEKAVAAEMARLGTVSV